MTDFDDIKAMLDLMDERGVEELEVERDGWRVRIRKPAEGSPAERTAPVDSTPAAAVTAAPEPEEEGPDADLVVVKSPIVGTFYCSPAPGSEPFVEVGSYVRKGQVLCIIEAMKLMNEIDADQDGEIAKVFVENGQPVQYGEPLFALRPA